MTFRGRSSMSLPRDTWTVILSTLLVATTLGAPHADAAFGTRSSDPAATISGFACGSAGRCIAVGAGNSGPVAYGTRNAGTAWGAEALPQGTPDLDQVACATATMCLAMGPVDKEYDPYESFLQTTDGGTTWVTTTGNPSLSTRNGVAWGLTCPRPRNCYVISSGFDVVRSTDGGRTWNDVPGSTAVRNGELDGISCASATTACMSVGHDRAGYLRVTETTPGGRSFVELAHVPKIRTAFEFQVSCGTARSCMVVDWEQRLVLASSDGGRSWIERHLPKTATGVAGLTCAGTGFCAAFVRSTANPKRLLVAATKDAGRTWFYSAVPTPSPSVVPGPLSSTILTCSSAALCFATLSSGGGSEIYARDSASGPWRQSLTL